MDLKHKRCWSFGLLLALCTISLFWWDHARPSEYLVVAHNNSAKNGGPLSVIDLSNHSIKKPQVPTSGCGGIVGDSFTNVGNLFVYCTGTKDTPNLWKLNPETLDVEKVLLLHPFEQINTPIHSQVFISDNGWQYFNDGGSRFVDNGELSDAGVVGINSTESFKVLISDRTQPYFIRKMIFDQDENTMWVMSIGTNTSVLVDRINLTTRTVDFSYTLESYSGFGMALNGDDVVVTTYRTKTGADITIFDKFTGEKEKEIALPVTKVLGLNALSLLVRKGNLFVSSLGGLYGLDTSTYEIQEFIPNNPESQYTYLINGTEGIYAIDTYDRVVEILDTDMLHPKLLLDGVGQGLTSLYYFVNK